jgi:Peptidase family M48
MRRSMLIVSLELVVAGCATATRPTLRPLEPADFMAVYPHVATFMRLQGDLPPRIGCPIGFGVLDTSALNAWVAVLPEPREPAPPLKALGETKEAPLPEPRSPPARCHPFALIVTAGALTLPRAELRAVVAHDLGHVYLGHIDSAHTAQLWHNAAVLFVAGLVPFLVMHAGTYPFMTAFSQSEEAAADRFAVDLLLRSRSSCDALAAAFERFRQAQDHSSSPRFEWRASHPAPDHRIETVRDLCAGRAG